MRTYLSWAFCALSLALMVYGMVVAVFTFNGAYGAILWLVGAFMYIAWHEKHFSE
jgi:hypothetical protein